LYWQHGAPSVNCLSNVLDWYSRFANRHAAEFCKGLEQQDAPWSPHSAGARARITLTSDIEAVA
jgi:hypothetical protein